MGDTVNDLPPGLATSVGALPRMDPDAAVDLAVRTNPEFPTAPTVRGMDMPHDAWDRFFDGVAASGASGVRLPVVGPVTVALSLQEQGLAASEALARATDTVREEALGLLSAVRQRFDGVVLVCADEPGLVGAMHPTFPYSPVEVLEQTTPLVMALDAADDRSGRLLIGIHVPGATDWSILLASGVSVASMPADPRLSGWAEVIDDFLDRGGRIIWGAVPVDAPLGDNDDLLWRRLRSTWDSLIDAGVDPQLLRARSLVSPADGLGHFGVTQAEHALSLAGSLSRRVRDEVDLLG